MLIVEVESKDLVLNSYEHEILRLNLKRSLRMTYRFVPYFLTKTSKYSKKPNILTDSYPVPLDKIVILWYIVRSMIEERVLINWLNLGQ